MILFKRFYVKPHTLKFWKSPDSNRTFLVLYVHPCPDPQIFSSPPPTTTSKAQTTPLTTLLHRCNSTARSFDLPLLYQKNGGSGPETDEDAFHVSLAWTLDDVPEGEEVIGSRDERDNKAPLDEVHGWAVAVAGVKVKIGNVVTHVGLEKGCAGGEGEIFSW